MNTYIVMESSKPKSDGLINLMQYRYQIKSTNKLPKNKPVTPNKTGINGCEDVSSIPDTPERHWPSPPVKVDVRKVCGWNNPIVLSDSDEDITAHDSLQRTIVSSPSSTISSPKTSVLPLGMTVSSLATNISSQTICILPRATCISPRATCISPRATCISPRAICISPRATCISPRATCISPQANRISLQATRISSQPTRISSQPTRIPYQATRIPYQATSIPSQATSIPSQATSIPSHATSISSEATSISSPATIISSEASSIASQPTSPSSSPWLSTYNGPYLLHLTPPPKRKRKSKVQSPDVRHDVKLVAPSENHVDEADSKHFQSTLSRLQSAFPAREESLLTGLLEQHNGDYERTFDAVIANIANGGVGTYSNNGLDDSPISGPKRKRIRMISDSSTELDSPLSDFSSQGLLSLVEAFPHHNKKRLNETLRRHCGDVEKAMAAIKKTNTLTDDISDIHSIQSIRSLATYFRQSTNSNSESPVETTESAGTKVKKGRPKGSKNSKAKLKKKRKGKKVKDVDEDDDAADPNADLDSDDSEFEESLSNSGRGSTMLKFFNTATVEECAIMPRCSRKKAEAIIAMRPFSSWANLVEKLKESKISMNLISGCRSVIEMRGAVLSLMQRCQKISTQIAGLVSRLMTGTTLETGDCQITHQPSLLNDKCTLKPYQMVGLNWLALLHRQELNGILADEMGLGKTIQAIALLAYLLEEGNSGPHIIVVPSSTIDNWLRELHTWCPTLDVILYYGSQDQRRALRGQLLVEDTTFNVILTTYNMACGSVEDRNLFKKYEFDYAIFDEAHMLKNMSSMRYRTLMKTPSRRRLLLTGTPLQNNLVELMSLLCFVMPHMFTNKTTVLQKMFTALSKGSEEYRGSYEKERINQAKKIMEPFVLRRLKTQVLKQMPVKREELRSCAMTADQRVGYEACVASITQKMTEDTRNGNAARSNYLMMLRKWANHSLLHRAHYTDTALASMAKLMKTEPTHCDANEQYVLEDMQVMSDHELHRLCTNYKSIRDFQLKENAVCESGKMRELDKLLPAMLERGDRVLLFSQFTMMLDIVQDYMNLRKYKYCRLDGQTPIVDRQDLIDKFNSDDSLFVFLLSTKAGGLGINLTAANVVIIHDIDFNPYNDKQAMDRCHRLGQTREVVVYRLISAETIEEHILKTAENKLRLEEDLTGRGRGADSANSSSDVASLLRTALSIAPPQRSVPADNNTHVVT